MAYNEFMIALLAKLEKLKSKAQINKDIKELEKIINTLRLTAVLARGDSKRELNQNIKQLESQLNHIKLRAKLDKKTLIADINRTLNNLSLKDIELGVIEGKTKLKAQKVIADVQRVIRNNPISINIELKKEKLNNQLTTYLKKNSKIRESEILLKEADNLREKISTINDRYSLRNARDSFQLFKSEVSATGYATKSTTERVAGLVKGITKVGSLFGVASIAVNNFNKSLNTIKVNDSILTEISKVSDSTKKQLEELGKASFNTASKYGRLSSDYLTAVQEMNRSGFYGEQGKALGELTLKTEAAGNITAETAQKYLLATNAAYGYKGSAEKLNAVLDGQNLITNRNSVDMETMATATEKVGSVAANSGVQINELSAIIGTISARTKEAGEKTGTGIKALLVNLQNISSTKIVNTLKKANAAMTETVNGIEQLRNPIEILKDLAKTYNSLDAKDPLKSEITTNIGQKHHANQLAALLSGWSDYEKMLKDYSEGIGSSEIEAKKTADSLQGRLNALQNSWDSLVDSVISKSAIKDGVSFFDGLIKSAEVLIDTFDAIPVAIGGITAAMTAINKDYGITQVVNPETKKVDLQGNLFGIDITQIKQQKKHFEEASSAIQAWNGKLANGVNDIALFNNETIKNNAQLKAYLKTCSADAPASLSGYKSYLHAAGISTDALRIKTILLNTAISFGLGMAIQGVISLIANMTQRTDELHNKASALGSEFSNTTSDIDSYKDKILELQNVINDSSSSIKDVTDARKQLMTIQNELINKYGKEESRIKAITSAINGQVVALESLKKAEWYDTKSDYNKKTTDDHIIDFITKSIPYYFEKVMLFGDDGKRELPKSKLEDMLDEWSNREYSLNSTGNQKLDDLIAKSLGIYRENGNFVLGGSMSDLKDDLSRIKEIVGSYKVSPNFEQSLEQVSNNVKEIYENDSNMRNQSILFDVVLSEDPENVYDELYEKIKEVKDKYDEAIISGDESKISSATDAYVKVVSDAMQTAINNNDFDVADYFENMYPELKEKVSQWRFDIAFKANTGNIKSEVEDALKVLHGLSFEDLKQFNVDTATKGQIDAFGKLISVADTYSLSIEQLLELLQQLDLVQTESYQEFVKLFGHDNIKKLTSQDLEIAYKIKNAGNMTFEQLQEAIKKAKEEVEKENTPSFKEIWEGLDDKVKDKLLELAKAGELTLKTFKNTEGVDGFIKQLKELGISAEESVQKINKMADSASQLSNMHNAISSLSENLYNKQQNPSEAISVDVLNGMSEDLKACTKEWNKYIITLGTASSSTEEVQQATDRLATAYVNSNNFLANLTDKTKDYYISQLDAMGVENAREVVLSALAMKESESIAIKIDLTNKTWDEITATNEYIKASNLTRQALAKLYIQKQLLNSQELKTANDIQNLINLAKEADITGKYIKRLMEIKSLYQSQENYLSNHQGAPVNFIELDKYKKKIQDIANTPITSDVDVKIDTSGSKSAMSDAKKSAKETKEAAKDTKTAIDWISQSLKVLQQNIDLTKAKFENLFTVKAKKNNVKEQIKETKTLLDQTKRSVKAYEKEFSKVMNKLRKPIKTTVKTVKKSGKDLVSVAEKELGYTEGRNNNTKYGKFTGQNFVAWCQSFVSWVANKAGLSTSQSPKTASTDTGMAFFKNKGEFGVKGKYTPKRNDTVYFKSGGRSHVGIVKAVKNGKIYTIEGNSGDKVKARSYSLNDATITGYGKTSKYFKAKNKKKTVEKSLTKKEISEIEQLITNAIKTKTALKKSMIVKKYGQERAKQIQDAIGSFENLQQAKTKVEELKKQVRELNKEFLQIDVDNYNKILDKYNAKLEITTSLTRQKNIEKNKLDIIKKSYDKQIEIAKIEKDSVKVAELRYQKEKEIYEIKQAILQHTLDDNESKRSLNNAKREGSSTAKVKAGYYDADVKSYDSDIKAYKDSVKDYNKRVNAKGKDIKNAKNLKKLTKADKKKVQECIKNGKVIPNNIIKKVEKISPTLKNKMDDYNVTVELAKLITQEAELGIAEAMNDKSEVKASKYDTYADEAQAVADAYSAQSFTQYSAKDKEALNKNIQKQMDKAYRNQIKAAEERGDYVLVTKLQAEWNKDKLDRKLESMQNYIDEKQAEMDLNDTYVEGAKSAWEKGVYLSRNKKIIQEQAEIEVEMLKKQGKYVEAQKVLVNAKQRQLEIERQIHSLIADAYDTLSGTHNTKADISTNIGNRLSNNIASMLYAQKSYDEKIKAESVPLKVEQLEVEKVKALNEAWMTAIGSIEQYFDRLKSDIETEQTHIQSMISLLETHGSFVNADMYTSLAEKETEKRKMALTEIKELQEYISKLPVGSDEWYDAQEKIKSLTKTAEESAIQFEEFSHKAIDAANAIKEFGRNAIDNLSSEADFYKSILAYSDLVDEDAGFFTKEGMATLALSADKISNNAAMVQKLNEAIEENQKLYVQGKIGFKEYTENYEKLNSERQNAILNVYAEKDAIKQLIEEAYNKQLQSLDDLIAKYKKALQAEKSLHDYQKNIEKQTKNLVTLQKRLAALQGDTSEEAKAKIQKLQVEIADAQDELDETEYSKYIEDQETMLDAMKEEYENFIKDQMDNATALVEKLIKELPMSAEEVTKVLQDIADENNTALSTALKTATQNGQYSAITKEVNNQGSQIATELGNLAESLASQDTLYSRTLDELTNVYNNENIIATSLPNISTILGEIKELIATKETQIIINAEEQASQNDIPENPPSQPITTPTPQEKPSENTNNQGTAIENAIGEMTNIKLPDINNQPSSMNEPTNVVVLKNKKQMLKEVKDFISEFSYTAPRKKSEYSKLNQYIYEKTDGEVLGDTELQKLAKKLGVTPGAKDDATWKNETLNKLKQVGYSQGGVVGALQRIPGENGDEGWATLKRGEAILTPEQTEMFKQFTSYLPEFNNPTKFDNIVKNYDVSKFVQKPKLDIGGINVTVDGSNITDAETFAKELPRAMINAIQKDKQCRMAFQDIGVGQLMGSNKSYMRYK